MKFSENWLRQHVTTDATRDELAATLTAIGLEVEELVPLGEELDGVVVARIVSAEKHPEADRLQVCQVDAGNGTMLQIVCGAPNARAGLVAPLATIGTRIGDITNKAAKLRGVERSEERRVGKECVSTCSVRWSANHYKKKQKKTQ